MMGILLIAGPYLFELDGKNTDSFIFFVSGAVLLLLSVCTNYEVGAFKIIPMRVHLAADVILGLLLAVSSWLFGFAERLFLPYLVPGAIAVVAAFLTNPTDRNTTRLI